MSGIGERQHFPHGKPNCDIAVVHFYSGLFVLKSLLIRLPAAFGGYDTVTVPIAILSVLLIIL